MRAFNGDPTLKERLLAEIGKHEAANAIIKGRYGEAGLPVAAFKGCAIGCTLHSMNAIAGVTRSVADRSRFPSELGIPTELAYFIEMVFENLPAAESRTWPRRVIEAIPVGVHLGPVMPALRQWMILDPTDGFLAHARPESHGAYRQLAAFVARNDVPRRRSVTRAEWDAVDNALAECEVWARAGAWAGAWAETWAETWARAGAWAWARGTGRPDAFSRLAMQTLRLLRACAGELTK